MLSKSMRMFVTVSVLAIIAAAMIACGGVSQTDFDAAKQQLAAQDQKVQSLQQQLSAKEKELADAKKQAAAPTAAPSAQGSQGVTILLGAKGVPSPAPRPTNTPLPAGFTPPPPPPAPIPPASFTEPVKLYIHADTITSSASESVFNVDASGIQNPSCVQTSVFKRGMHLVWRFEVVDVTTGKRLTDGEVATAVVKLPTGEEIKGRFGRHGATSDSPWFWTASWDIPPTYPLGVLDWTLNVTSKDSKSASFKLWNISNPDRGVEARTQIID